MRAGHSLVFAVRSPTFAVKSRILSENSAKIECAGKLSTSYGGIFYDVKYCVHFIYKYVFQNLTKILSDFEIILKTLKEQDFALISEESHKCKAIYDF